MPFRREDYWIKPKKRLLEYQVKFFEREIRREQKLYDNLLAGQEKRAEAWQPKFKSWDDLQKAYIAGISGIDWNRQRLAVWHVYSDRGHPARIKWLTEERNKYQKQLDLLMEYIEDLRQDTKRRHKIKQRKHNRRGMQQRTIDKLPYEEKLRVEEKNRQRRAMQKKRENRVREARRRQMKQREEKYKEFFK